MMTRVIHLHRGAFGWFFEIVFYVFNVVMVAWLFFTWAKIGHIEEIARPAIKGLEELGAAVGILTGLFVWMAGDVILGLLTLVARGRKATFEEEAR
jgi:hypothetical protein